MKQMRLNLLSLIVSFLAFFPPSASAQDQPSKPVPFPTPAGLESSVNFWKKIFSEYGLSQMIYFDPEDMSKIYDVVDAGEESRSNDYINSERARVAAANGVDIERVKVQRGVKERTAAGIKRSGRHIAQIQQILRDAGLPVELSYLPIVESSYDNYARSSVGALGLWQFMPTTGRQYMRVNRAIDERRDRLESTRAAAAYLQQAYETLGSWPLAITSYDYGIGGIARATGEVGSNELTDLIERHNSRNWGFAPKQFYAEFLAAVEIGTNLGQYFPGLELDAAVPIQEMELPANTSIASLMKTHRLSRDQLLGWNPALNASTNVVPAEYRVKIPSDRNSTPPIVVAQAQQSKRESQAKRTTAPGAKPVQVVHHRVKPGETLFQIAQRYGASVQRILQANGLRRAHMVRAGTTLVIPKV